MKNLLAIIVVAILATSAMFAVETGASGNGQGVCNITVNHVDIQVLPAAAVTLDMFPGSTSLANNFTFGFSGSLGIGWIVSGAWSGLAANRFAVIEDGFYKWDGSALVSTTNNGTFSSTPIPGGFSAYDAITYQFKVKCLSGTPKNTYQGTYTLTVNYQ